MYFDNWVAANFMSWLSDWLKSFGTAYVEYYLFDNKYSSSDYDRDWRIVKKVV